MADDILNDKAKGDLKQTGGTVQEKAGEAVGDREMQRQGEENQAEGKLQKAWGNVKDAAKDVVDGDND